MRALLDTHVVLRQVVREDPAHKNVDRFLKQQCMDGQTLCILPQCIHELWVVATRPAGHNGLGKTPAECKNLVDQVLSAYTLLREPDEALQLWMELCVRYSVRGRPAHDARLVAAMLSLGITVVITLNPADFKRYDGIECAVPFVS